jgi:hypothetical protein
MIIILKLEMIRKQLNFMKKCREHTSRTLLENERVVPKKEAIGLNPMAHA